MIRCIILQIDANCSKQDQFLHNSTLKKVFDYQYAVLLEEDFERLNLTELDIDKQKPFLKFNFEGIDPSYCYYG
ncbi:hypothetical protein NE610_13460, partial [Enterococcus faecium]|uniref:hypothetical protein n=1 Tax=Enterococcus faecium TaxID=1352 RepID=UPI00210874FA